MAVLIEGISVVIQASTLVQQFAGGVDAFDSAVPNQTLCADGELVRVGFMTPKDTETFLHVLTTGGLTHLKNGRAVDIVVVDQLHGCLSECSWVQFGHVRLHGDETQTIAACRLVGGEANTIAMPLGWQFERSLSKNGAFVPTEDVDTRMKFLRKEKGVDVYLDLETGTEKYVGRP